MIKTTIEKPTTLRRYVIKVQSIVALIVVLSYTLVINFYFIHGLDEANFQDLHLESNRFAEHYNQGLAISPPDSLHFKGYVDWDTLPIWAKKQFPRLENITQIAMKNERTIDYEHIIPWPVQATFIIAQPLNDGHIFYLIRQINIKEYDALSKMGIARMFTLTWPLALLFFLMLHLMVHLILKRTLKPFHQLGDWVDTLTLENVGQAIPSFEFTELNRIAKQQQAALHRISDVLEKEQDFLRHASHELRTPIAVIKSNSELLNRVLTDRVVTVEELSFDSKELAAVARINRASLNMQHMTETLLWLSREENSPLVKTKLTLAKMIENLVEDNQYLLQGKSVEITLDLENTMIELAETPCRLILNNLIRNAFQYTAEGEVNINCKGNRVVITNINKSLESFEHIGTDYGYGLGLRLVDKIVKKMTWQYHNNELVGGRTVMVDFR